MFNSAEIVSLVELLHPTAAEAEARRTAVSQVEAVAKSIWPQSEVQVFGSFATGLYVPTSDVDLVILNSDASSNLQASLKALASSLHRKGVAQGIQVIGRARVPIIKFETVDHGRLAFDVSFDVANGPEAAELVKEFVGDWPMMRPLILILKLFLQQRELNEVYTGGIGSYALITMVAAFMQLHFSRRPKSGKTAQLLEPSLGVLLVDFFRFYGRVINNQEVGISCDKGGHFYLKRDKGGQDWQNEERPYMLSVEDPKDDTNDICRSSFNIMRVKSAFDFAYQISLHYTLCHRLGPMLASREKPTNARALYKASSVPTSASTKKDPTGDGAGVDEEAGGSEDMVDLVSGEDAGDEDEEEEDYDEEDEVTDTELVGDKRKQKQHGSGGERTRDGSRGEGGRGEGKNGGGKRQKMQKQGGGSKKSNSSPGSHRSKSPSSHVHFN
eukprot:gene1683-33079_t